jgi:hypothetical protein
VARNRERGTGNGEFSPCYVQEIAMSPPEKVRARLEMLDERLARLRAERERLVARTNRVERKRDTRRKIVIGGTVLAAVDHEGVPALPTRAELVRWLDARLDRPQDRRAFELPPQSGRLAPSS